MNSKVKVKQYNKSPYVSITGNITAEDTPDLSKKINDSCEKAKGRMVVIDLSEADTIDSFGLGVLVYAWRFLKDNEKDLIIFKPKPVIKRVFIDTHLDKLFTITDNLEDL